MYLVGLTGGIATGKSTVSQIFVENRIPVIDADLIAREVVAPGKNAYKKLRQHFGNEFFDCVNGELLRKKFGDLVFSDENVRHLVNSIVHPEIRKTIVLRILQHFFRGEEFVILDLPLLFEAGYAKFLLSVVLVDCPEDIQLKRLQQRDNIDEEAAQKRINAQHPMSDKRRRATHVVDNSGTMEETRAQVLNLIREFNASKLHLIVRAVLLSALLTFFTLGYLLYHIVLLPLFDS
ncbi:dephospho-CoA kinase [Loa loa]|uniref:Dephospho-CoA kinase domain-containing protein n=1 Tax=Loa loa TaxID=7209 RepID=A0A1I7V8V6_LOALO|nr:dephospho-CoA kinase [Loa loa]EFO20637.1 dephospho-CoA kinase [Loa loa]